MHKPAQSPQRSLPGAREMVVMMAMVMALNALAIDSMLPALPAIGQALGVTVAKDRQHVISIYLLGTGSGSQFYGPLSARFGRKGGRVPAVFAYLALSIGRGSAPRFEMTLWQCFCIGLGRDGLGGNRDSLTMGRGA